jgi:hypothetical protein
VIFRGCVNLMKIDVSKIENICLENASSIITGSEIEFEIIIYGQTLKLNKSSRHSLDASQKNKTRLSYDDRLLKDLLSSLTILYIHKANQSLSKLMLDSANLNLDVYG